MKKCLCCNVDLPKSANWKAVYCKAPACQEARLAAKRDMKNKYQKEYIKNNKEKRAQTMLNWHAKNPGYMYLKSYERQRKLKERTFPGDAAAVEAIYLFRRRLNEIIVNVKYVVDHIVPIKGENVCGLHVSWNLRVIPYEENARKLNKFNPQEDQHLEC